jgi:hypothetical protein
VCVYDDGNHQVTDISLVPVEVLFRTLRIKRFFFFRFLWFCFFVVEIHCKQVEWDPSREALDRSHWIDDRERRGCWFASILVVEINALSNIEERERERAAGPAAKGIHEHAAGEFGHLPWWWWWPWL